MNKSNQLIVLGMHRSGTSIVSNIVSDLGYDMGDSLIGSSSSNVSGHYEDRALVDLNDEVLEALGGDWMSPPSREVIVGARSRFGDKFAKYVELRDRSDRAWAAKDPRLSLTIDLMLPYLNQPFFIFCQRSEDAVAESLVARNSLSKSEALAIKRHYDNAILQFFADQPSLPVLTIQYEELMSSPEEVVTSILEFLGQTFDDGLLKSLSEKVMGKSDLAFAKLKQAEAAWNEHKKKLATNPFRALTLPYWRKHMRLRRLYVLAKKGSQ